jgi:hypothetical protein
MQAILSRVFCPFSLVCRQLSQKAEQFLKTEISKTVEEIIDHRSKAWFECLQCPLSVFNGLS